ncbi:MAG: uroporphyrinogen decarboxylase, partial [Alphaproteobacteria bacterium]|nr:uroporphyrinogen decarboxylase [Alphaproteobacteria bacterium]
FLDFCYRSELAVEATMQPIRRFGMDAAILFSDILVVPDALGQKVEFRENEGPVLQALKSAADFSRLKPENLHGKLTPVYETLRALSSKLPAETALIGFSGAPWTVAVYMVEGRGGTDCGKIRRWFKAAPADAETLLTILADATADYLIRQVENGAEALQIFDSWAGVLDAGEFRRYVIEPTKRIMARLRQHCPDVPVIGFPRQAGALYAEYARTTGVDGLSLDSSVSAADAVGIGGVRALQGNLDNQILVAGGRALDDAVRRVLEEFADRPHIFNLGHGILPETPVAHVERLAAILRDWKG